MTWVAPLGVLIALVLIIFLAMKGFNILVIGPLCSLIVILTNQMDVFGALFTGPSSYMAGTANFIASYFIIFLLGSILGKYMEESGAARAIANYFLKLTGKEKPFAVLIAIYFICVFMTYGGISCFVVFFVVIPLVRPIFKELNISWKLLSIPAMLGTGTVTMTMLPGTPSLQNVVPTQTLGTTLTAAPLVGIVASLAAFFYGLWYMKRELKKSFANNEGYDEPDKNEQIVVGEGCQGPGSGISLAPLLTLIFLIIVGSILKVTNIIIIGLLASVLVVALLLRRYIKDHKAVINSGAQGSIGPVFFTAATVGFGVVVTAAPGFKVISDYILNMPGNPLISLSVATSLMALITGSATGSIGIIIPTFADVYLSMGISPEAIHRVAAIASGTLGAMPHCGVVLTYFALTGLNHKNSYKHIFMTMVVGNTIALIAALVTAIAIY
ncbi:MAG TPA: GntP family permease [Peptococcaceae bacterium]|nr:GntP family permease [Peptococcaceae bacterium]